MEFFLSGGEQNTEQHWHKSMIREFCNLDEFFSWMQSKRSGAQPTLKADVARIATWPGVTPACFFIARKGQQARINNNVSLSRRLCRVLGAHETIYGRDKAGFIAG